MHGHARECESVQEGEGTEDLVQGEECKCIRNLAMIGGQKVDNAIIALRCI